jgi:hypothetical protein
MAGGRNHAAIAEEPRGTIPDRRGAGGLGQSQELMRSDPRMTQMSRITKRETNPDHHLSQEDDSKRVLGEGSQFRYLSSLNQVF